MDRVIQPCSKLNGTLSMPGDKSISHRLAMLCGLASGESVIHNFLTSEDCLNTLGAVEQLGARAPEQSTVRGFAAGNSGQIRIVGTGGRFKKPDGVLDMGNSGTGMRLLAGLLAGQAFISEMTGDESLRSRPMKRIKDPLEMMGARVELLGDGGCAPVKITGGGLKGIEYELPVASAQVKSCILLAGLFAEGRTTVVEPRPTRDHTEKLLRAMGVDVQVDGLRISVEGTKDPMLVGGEWTVPGDFSSAAFWLTAAAAMPGAKLTIKDVGLNSRRTAFLGVLRRMGGTLNIEHRTSNIEHSGWGSDRGQGTEDRGQGEEIGDINIVGGDLHAVEVGGDEIPNLIDELPLVAVLGALADGQTVIKDAAELRVKESDRISAVAEGLRIFGVHVDEKPDGLVVEGGGRIRGGCEIDSRGDHRIAMSMAVLGLFADAPVTIKDVACVDTSYPGFWKDMETIVLET